MSKEKCITVQFKETGTIKQFGSIAAIYDMFTTDQLNVSQNYLYQRLRPLKPYENVLVVITSGLYIGKKAIGA